MRSRGFTLLEVLVAISIFALIGLAANKMLGTMIETRSRTEVSLERFAGLTRTFQFLELDLSQVAVRSVRDNFGDPLDPLMVSAGIYALELTRAGWRNPAGVSRSKLQRVAYELTSEGELNRYFWLVLDRAEDSEPVIQRLLADVTDFRVNVLDIDNSSTSSWPANSSSAPGLGGIQGDIQGTGSSPVLPRAVEIILVVKGVGEVRKVVNLVSDSVTAVGPDNPPGGSEN